MTPEQTHSDNARPDGDARALPASPGPILRRLSPTDAQSGELPSGSRGPDLPIAELVESARLEPAADHWSDADVFRISGSPFGDMFLKTAPVDAWYALRSEAARLKWLNHRVPGPDWWKFEVQGERERLLTAAVPGRSLRSWGDSMPASDRVQLQAEVLRSVHDVLRVDECPFTLTNAWQIDFSQRLKEAGKIDSDYLAEVTGGWTIAQAFEYLASNPRPDHLDDVVLHGDPYAGNLIVNNDGTTWGLVDWGWCGVGDRWHDLANVYVNLERRAGREWAEAFLSEYGVERDDDALTYFRVLDGLR